MLQSGGYELPFGTVDVTLDPATARWGNLMLVDFTPAYKLHIKGLQNCYRQRGIGAPLAADATEPVDEKGFQRREPAWDRTGVAYDGRGAS
jgi:hypothetical protein